MSIKLAKLRCPRCGKSLGIPRKLAGKTTPCPKCGESFTIADDLSKLISLAPPTDEEPIVAQSADAAEPPLAMSVEKPESRFPWLVLIIVGVTIVTLLVIGGVVMSLPSSPPESPALSETTPEVPEETESTDEMESKEEASDEVIYDRSPQPFESAEPME